MPKAPTYEPDVEYRVQLAKVVTVFGRKLLPRHEHTMLGSLITKLIAENGADVIESAERI